MRQSVLLLELFSYSLLLAMSGEQKKVHRSPVKGFCDAFVEKMPLYTKIYRTVNAIHILIDPFYFVFDGG